MMNSAEGHQLAPQTRVAALACMEKIQAVAGLALRGCCSPLFAMADIVERLTRDPYTSRRIAVIRASRHMSCAQEGMLASAWPLRFAAQAGRVELPLIYMISSETSAELSALASESSQRGIFCNDIETLPSRWPKGAHPWLPLWLLSNHKCHPYDPADAAEARAITLYALHSLYVEGRAGFYYMALHDEFNDEVSALSETQAAAAVKGMYRIGDAVSGHEGRRVRLLGAGLALRSVRQAASLLKEHWDVDCEIWSCPSYTRLARDADSARRWNRFHPAQIGRSWHLRDCLGEGQDAVVAVTGYPQAVVEQLREHVPGRFVAVGADSAAPQGTSATRPEWIVVQALTALAEGGQLGYEPLKLALQRYRLV
ncbi:Pyruvate dehydrogenase [Pseudomonas caricapapayae]|uniref:Pyruvate dehydrogenase n=2 Tax=Pseudomonas TaxID=286 RepID=A0A3M6EVN9_9PSED|nr:Pyruvate dehydrogenase [Pseudomonas syringae pv. helianthi]RMV72428.1 Pyruvate dehydrogenase [Pseudomonas caricapapayae]